LAKPFRNALDDPPLPEVVVHHEDPVRLEHPFHVTECLDREQEALEAEIRIPAVEYERVDESVGDQVVRVVGDAEEVPAVVHVTNDARVLIGPVRMMPKTDVEDHGVDLDGVDSRDTEPKGVGDVVSGACSDDEHVLERRAGRVLLQQVDQRVRRAPFLEGDHLLVADRVDDDLIASAVVRDRIVG
jgi:hypothetical protein